MMNFDEYTKKSLRTMDEKMSRQDAISMLCMGLSGETGEIVDYLKKVFFHGKALDREHLILEFGDLIWYFAVLAHYFNFSFSEILKKNVEKLLKRYPNGFKKQNQTEAKNFERINQMTVDKYADLLLRPEKHQ